MLCDICGCGVNVQGRGDLLLFRNNDFRPLVVVEYMYTRYTHLGLLPYGNGGGGRNSVSVFRVTCRQGGSGDEEVVLGDDAQLYTVMGWERQGWARCRAPFSYSSS